MARPKELHIGNEKDGLIWKNCQQVISPFQYPPLYTVPPPKATGNVYFFIGISNPAVIKEFPNNSIFTCDANFNWQRYK